MLVIPAARAATITISQAGADSDSVMKGEPFTIQVSGLSGSGTVSLINLPAGFSAEGSPPYSKSFSSESVTWTTPTISQSHESTTITASIEVVGSPDTVESDPFAVKLPPSIDVISYTPTGPLSEPTGTATINLNFRNTGETKARNVVVAISPGAASLSSGSLTETISEIDGKPNMPSVGRSWVVDFGTGFSQSGSITLSVMPSNADSKTNIISISVPQPEEDGAATGAGGGVLPERAKNATRRPELVPGLGIRNNTRLQAALEKVLSIAKMSANAVENMIRLSESVTSNIEMVRNFEAKGNRSTLSMNLKYKGEEKANNFTVYDSIPKAFASSSDLITVNAPGCSYEVVEKDPEYVFVYPEVSKDQSVSITYTINEEVGAGVINQTETEIYAMSLGEPAPEQFCIPGTKRCLGDNLQQCNTEGDAWVTLQACMFGCDPTAFSCRFSLSLPPLTDYTFYIGIVAILLIALVVYYLKGSRHKKSVTRTYIRR